MCTALWSNRSWTRLSGERANQGLDVYVTAEKPNRFPQNLKVRSQCYSPFALLRPGRRCSATYISLAWSKVRSRGYLLVPSHRRNPAGWTFRTHHRLTCNIHHQRFVCALHHKK
jgi:hypothetical protein